MIRNAKIGDIVYLEQGYGPKCKIVDVVPFSRFTLYHAKILKPRGHKFLTPMDSVVRRAGEFSRMKKCVHIIGDSSHERQLIRCPNAIVGEGDYCPSCIEDRKVSD